mmetsp:Transcript_28241/g.57016  ORF Transcript_28241/g.57016 Transcript_28241/m.57016 type:complete len:261 (-) Transcript_28241:715-1497(-)
MWTSHATLLVLVSVLLGVAEAFYASPSLCGGRVVSLPARSSPRKLFTTANLRSSVTEQVTKISLSDKLTLDVHECSIQKPTEFHSIEGKTTGPSSLEMAGFLTRQIEQHPDLLANQRVLELGAGTGLCSLALASFSRAKTIMASDIDPRALELIASSAKHKNLPVHLLDFDFCDTSQPLPACDWLLASDVICAPRMARRLADRCAEALSRGGVKIVVGDPGRAARKVFLDRLAFMAGKAAAFEREPQISDGLIILLHTQP